MSMSDPLADMCTRIRNALSAGHGQVDVPGSRLKQEICSVLQREGYIEGFERIEDGKQGLLRVSLRYETDRKPVLRGIRRVSKPSLRVYGGSRATRIVRSGLGISIVTTSRGVMTGRQARKANVGGEVICEVW
jgi:small subunit ribosomal protein S8